MFELIGERCTDVKSILVAASTAAITGASTLSSDVTVGNGYAGTGSALTALGAIGGKGALQVAFTSTLGGIVEIGGAYASTGITITDASLVTVRAGYSRAMGAPASPSQTRARSAWTTHSSSMARRRSRVPGRWAP